ncbi:hypothetical protein QZH41_020542 [Actinostola sp. cb2023]|nr:hypothetical protein QZH41_020542 [Actinostola sp. cb2023]
MLSNAGRFMDRNSDIPAAGKLFDVTGHTARDCLQIKEETKCSDEVKKFRAFTQPREGIERVFYGRADDPNIAVAIQHGVSTKPSLWAGDLANPPKKSLFAQKMLVKKEGIYASHNNAPLGQCHDQIPNLPNGAKLYEDCYGVKTIKDGSAGEMVNPDKTAEQVIKESMEGKELYKFSHHDYDVGESYERKYNWSRVPKDSTFGIGTPHNNDGIHVKKSLKWLHDTQQECTKIVSKRVDNFRERTQPQLGQAHDPIKDTLNVGPDYVFGVLVKPDEYGAGDLIHMRMSSDYLRGKERERGIIAAIRQHLKKANYHNFNDLQAAFAHYDKDKSGKISMVELENVCTQFNLPVEQELLKSLLAACDSDRDGQINYVEFANFLNWKDQMPTGKIVGATMDEQGGKQEDASLTSLTKQIDKAVGGWKQSSSLINATVGGIRTGNWRAYGVPTIRADLAAPRIRRVGDRINYGDESDAYGLINPSLYSNHGVYEKDFFQPRDKFEMRRIIDGIGVEMTPEIFNTIWDVASTTSPQGLVSLPD